MILGARRRRAVVVYTRAGCGLCRRAEEVVASVARRGDEVTLLDVDADPVLQRQYNLRVPVVEVDGTVVAEGLVDPATVRAALRG